MKQIHKKAQVSTLMMTTIPRLLFLIVVLFSVVFLIRQFVSDSLNVQEVQSEVFIDKILYSPNGILYYDAGIQRTVPGIIDPLKLKPEVLDSLADYGNKEFIAATITLSDVENKVVSSATYNKETYLRWKKLAVTELTGAGGVKLFTKTILVNYMKEGLQQGYLKFEVLLPGN